MTRCAGCEKPVPPNKGPGPARKWCSERCRKNSYGDSCVDCGAKTRFGAEVARVPEPRCVPCTNIRQTVWTRERIISRIQEWGVLYGEPPAIADWNPSQARILNDPERAQRYLDAEGYWPAHRVVYERFGSWNAAIDAAGFEPRPRYGGGGNQLRRRKAMA